MTPDNGMPPSTPAPAAPPPPPSPAPASSPMSNMFATFTQAELFVAGGAALIVLTDIVFAMFGPYSFSNVIWTTAAVA